MRDAWKENAGMVQKQVRLRRLASPHASMNQTAKPIVCLISLRKVSC